MADHHRAKLESRKFRIEEARRRRRSSIIVSSGGASSSDRSSATSKVYQFTASFKAADTDLADGEIARGLPGEIMGRITKVLVFSIARYLHLFKYPSVCPSTYRDSAQLLSRIASERPDGSFAAESVETRGNSRPGGVHL